ncbi:MAG TPA: tetratricopeptide repeat protein, partial [Chloroflexota bacterium]|nr:tetratricopeptide repeat protein [Chloroflexota bacterium]
GCSKTETATAPPKPIREVTLPDLSPMDATVQQQVRDRYAAVNEARKKGTGDADLSEKYGQYGMVLQAAEYYEAAEPAYLNAQALSPNDLRWPYYLGHLYKSQGQTAKAIQAFTRSLELGPNEIATLIWLGRLYLEQGQPEMAEALFVRAAALPPKNVAVLAGLGQAALARRDYQRAASLLEEALALDPSALSVNSPLAMAYRGLGDTAKAEAHVKQWRNTEVLVPDRLRMDLDLALESGLSYELRGVRALESHDWDAAEGFFRKGVAITTGSTALGRSLRHKLGTALFLKGDVKGAMERFEEVTRLAPPDGYDESSAKAFYSLGVIMASTGRNRDAIERFSRAVSYNPNYVEALTGLADALRRGGRVEESLKTYAEIVRINPRATDAKFGYAIGLVRLHRYRDARDWLVEATRVQPDQPELALALARILAAAPDSSVRDGARAMAITEELFKGAKTTVLGETLAMALAAVGQYEEAARIQRGVLDAAKRAGLRSEVREMTANLRLYEQHMPCRMPWADDNPIHSPGPPVVAGLATESSAGAPAAAAGPIRQN